MGKNSRHLDFVCKNGPYHINILSQLDVSFVLTFIYLHILPAKLVVIMVLTIRSLALVRGSSECCMIAYVLELIDLII